MSRVIMEGFPTNELLIERRFKSTESPNYWDQLTLAQKFAASSLTQFGYGLEFVRGANHINSLAVLFCDNNRATILSNGDIDTSPAITVRLC